VRPTGLAFELLEAEMSARKLAQKPRSASVASAKKLIQKYLAKGKPFTFQDVYSDSSDPTDGDLYDAFSAMVKAGEIKGPDPHARNTTGDHGDWKYKKAGRLHASAEFNPEEIGQEKRPAGDPDELRIVQDTDQRWFHEVADLYPSDGKVWDGNGKAPENYRRTTRLAHRWLVSQLGRDRINRVASRWVASRER